MSGERIEIAGRHLPAWWCTDREHAPAVFASRFLDKQIPWSDEAELDFEAWWKEPMSSGERVLVALAWSLYNVGWAMQQEQREAKRKTYAGGPLFWANPCRAMGSLGDEHWAAYLHMVDVGRGTATL